MSDCIFCKFVSKEQEVEMIYESDNFFAINDVNPKAKGHCLIISKKHYATLLDMPTTLGGELVNAIKEVIAKKMKEDSSIKGFNVMQNNFKVAGQVVPHLHFHILPRRENDGKEHYCV
ncbi:MAG: HIT family protein [Nanoarchaeota archaeon]|nr:HIT family protein [Nanoarchaeota archaeon]